MKSPDKEPQKLQAYQDAISALSPEQQIKKMNAIEAQQTLRRFLSKDAPIQLVERFAHRVYETDCIPDGQTPSTTPEPEGLETFSRYETARIYAVQGNTQHAINTLIQTPVGTTQNPDANDETLLLGQILLNEENNETLGIQALESLEKIGHKKPSPALSLFEHFHRQDETLTALTIGVTLMNDEQVSDKDKQFVAGVNHLHQGKVQKGVEILEHLAAQGHFRALTQLHSHYTDTGDTPNLEKTILRQIHYGEVKMYLNLSQHYRDQGDSTKALQAAEAAVELELIGGYDMQIRIYCEDLEDLKTAYSVANQAMDKSGYAQPAILLAYYCYINKFQQFSQSTLDRVKKMIPDAIDPESPDNAFAFLVERAVTNNHLHDIPHLAKANDLDESQTQYLYTAAALHRKDTKTAMTHFRRALLHIGDLEKIAALQHYQNNRNTYAIHRLMLDSITYPLKNLGLTSLINRLEPNQMN